MMEGLFCFVIIIFYCKNEEIDFGIDYYNIL